MRKLFIQFYFLLITSFLAMALLMGSIYQVTVDRAMDKSLDDLMESSLSLLRFELGHAPPEEWNNKLAQIDSPLSFDIGIQPLSDAQNAVEPAARKALSDGDIIMLEDQDRFMQRLPQTDYVMVVGPINYLSFRRELRLFDYLAIVVLGLSLAIPVFAWMRPHWRDLSKLEEAAHRLGNGDLSARSQLAASSSLQRLGTAFDLMATNLQNLMASRKHLTDGIAHELRTPLVRLRYRLALLDHLPEEVQEGIESDLSSLDKLIDEMLIYARLDRPEPNLKAEHWVVADWLQRRINDWKPLARDIQLELTLPEQPIFWDGDQTLIARAIDNLIGNALRYANERVRIEVYDCVGRALIRVADDGPGISDEFKEQVFEPFIRLDPSRDRQTGGYGLGLAIVAGIMRAHDGTVELQTSPLGGAGFTLSWPQKLPSESHFPV